MDRLYYEDGCSCCHGFSNAAEGIRFSPDVLATFLRKVYNGFDTSHDIEPTAWREALRLINEATVEGLSRADVPPTHEEEFYRELRHSNEVFAAFKVHSMGEKMAAKLTTQDGKLKPFRQWAEEVQGISSHYVGSWLRTEYDTAIIRAHTAADWRRFERDKDIMPNLRWMPTTSPEPDSAHRVYWQNKLTLPVDHPFWNRHHPGDRWNCKCILEQTDEPANPEVLEDIEDTPPQRGLENNPGKDGHTFNDTHPYFPKNCSSCPVYHKSGIKNRLLTLFENRKKDCYNCPFIDGCIDRIQAKQAIDNAAFARKQEVKDSDLMPKLDKQSCDAVKSGTLNRTNKVRNTLLKHCHHDYDVDAAIHIWNNPNEMKFIRVSPLGEGKDMSLPKNQANIRKKIEDLHFVEFRQYEFSYNGRTFEVKLALCKKGYEQFYSLKEK